MTIKTYTDYITYAANLRTSATDLADSLTTVGSHDEVTRWLVESNYTPDDLWGEVKNHVDLDEGYLVVDDTVIEKPHSSEDHSDLVKWCWSDGYVKGINLVKVLWVRGDLVIPIDYRIIAESDDATKNEILREMLRTAKHRGFRSIIVLFDSWYAANETLKLVDKLGFKYVTRFKSNRRVVANGVNVRITSIASKNARVVLVPGVGDVKVIVTDPSVIIATNDLGSNRRSMVKRYRARWKVEEFFRATKQVYRLAGCQARKSEAWATHIYASILAYAKNALAGADHYELKTLACQKMLGDYLSA